MELAGRAGTDRLEKFGLAELVALGDGREKAAWRHTALLYSGAFKTSQSLYREAYPFSDSETKGTIAGRRADFHMMKAFALNARRRFIRL